MTAKREQFDALLEAILATEAEEIDCDAFLVRAAELLEAVVESGDVPPDLAPVFQHLSVCPECREEFDALIRASDS